MILIVFQVSADKQEQINVMARLGAWCACFLMLPLKGEVATYKSV